MPYLLIGRPWPRAQHPKNVVLACVHAQHCGPTVRARTIKAAHSRSIGFQINRKEEALMSKRRSSAAIARHALTPKTRSMCAAAFWNGTTANVPPIIFNKMTSVFSPSSAHSLQQSRRLGASIDVPPSDTIKRAMRRKAFSPNDETTRPVRR